MNVLGILERPRENILNLTAKTSILERNNTGGNEERYGIMK